MTTILSASKWSILTLPFLVAQCNSNNNGNSPSPSSSLNGWLSLNALDYLPVGAVEALHHIPVINWLI